MLLAGSIVAGLLMSAPQGSSVTFEVVAAELERAQLDANNNPKAGTAPLREAIRATHEHAPALAADPARLELRNRAQLNLARAYQRIQDDAGAVEALREAARLNLGIQVAEIQEFSPAFIKWASAELQRYANEGMGTIEIVCVRSCNVYVNERAWFGGTSLPYGQYRVWIEATDGSVPLERVNVDVRAGETPRVSFGQSNSDSRPASDQDEAEPDNSPAESKAVAPAWAKGLLIAGGAVVSIVGGVLIGVDGRCVGGGDPVVTPCPLVNRTLATGSVFVTVGVLGLGTGITLFGVDLHRRKRSTRGH